MIALPRLSRRSTLLGLSSAVVLGPASLALAAAPTEQRFVVIILRGGMDGLSAVVPYGDPNLATWRNAMLPPPGQAGGLLYLGGFYGLHPVLTGMHTLYKDGDLLPVHAVAGHYRSRSHFEAQDYLEGGADQRMDSGRLNRALSLMPKSTLPKETPALAVSVTVPLMLRGPVNVETWAPPTFTPLDDDLYTRVVALNQDDPVTGPALRTALQQRGFSDKVLAAAGPQQHESAFATLCTAAAALLRAPNGPRVAALELEGWDTHSAQPPRLAAALADLDSGVVALKAGMGDLWRRTVVVMVTEFGRTVRPDGSLGTDHGTGTAAFIAGGSVAGGRVQANWPGLARHNLFEDRDLQPTADLRAVGKGLLAQHLGLSPAALLKVFPGSADVKPMQGLLRA